MEIEMGYYAIRSLLPAIMDWVDTSKLKKALPAQTNEFLKQLGNVSVQINLSYLSKEYQQKYIEPNFVEYCKAFTEQLKPVLRKWCIKCNLEEVRVDLHYSGHLIYGTHLHVIVSREELRKYHS